MGIKPWLWTFAIANLVLFCAAIALGLWVWLGPVQTTRELVKENRARITDNRARTAEIQASRTSSCRQTYEGIREVFTPFFPPPPRTAKQQADLDKFNKTIDRRKHGCGGQTKPNHGGSR